MKWCIASPRDVALTILHARAAAPPYTGTLDLAEFQRGGVSRALAILQQRGLVLIADSVGLGKTFTGLALLEHALEEDRHPLVVVPASLKSMWRREFRRLAHPIDVVTHTALATRPVIGEWDFILVDEAHAFRNPHTLRYRALRRLCRPAQVALLTATPVNNSLSDLCFLLRLKLSDSALRDLGIGSLTELLTGPDPPRNDLHKLRDALIVRRTRAAIRGSTDALRFPDRLVVEPMGYALPTPVPMLADMLDRLRFAAYQPGAPKAGRAELLRYALLKRFDSGLAAIRSTLTRQIRFHEEFLQAYRRGRLLRPDLFRHLYGDDGSQLVFEEIALDIAIARGDLAQRVIEDLAVLRRWQDSLVAAPDAKLAVLMELLGRRAGRRTIVFTEYRDTARSLWRVLRRRFPTALIDGEGAWLGESRSTRREVVAQFSPDVNRHGPRLDTVEVLIATDVLAEGANLQAADAVVSYDLPWNPIKLVQRAGRIDRIGSSHNLVTAYNFIPDREFDTLIGLARTLRTKLEAVRSSVGLERAVLEPDELPETVPFLTRPPGIQPPEFPPGQTPVACLGGAASRILVAVRTGRGIQLLDNQDHGAPADQLLVSCLESTVPSAPPAGFDAAVENLLRRGGATAVHRRSAPARLARGIRRRLLAARLEEVALFERADRVLLALAGQLSEAAEAALEDVAETVDSSLKELLGSVESALSHNAESCAAARAPVLIAVLVAD